MEMMCSSKTIVVLEMSKINVFVRQQTYVFGYKKNIKQSVFGRRLSRVVCSVWEISSYSSGLVGSEPITMGLLLVGSVRRLCGVPGGPEPASQQSHLICVDLRIAAVALPWCGV